MAGHTARWQHCCVIDMVPGLSALFHLDRPEDDTKPGDKSDDGSFQDWLKNVFLSVSTDGLLLAIANATQTVFMTASSTTAADVQTRYQLAWQGSLQDAENDRITAVLCLTVNPPKSGSSWQVVVVGFSSGYLRFYLPSGELLLSRWLHREPVHSIRCHAGGIRVAHSVVKGEEVLITYGTIVVAVGGYSLINCLRACLHKTEDTQEIPSLSYKKYSFSGITQVNDLTSLGVQTRSPLSQLREASFRETPVKEIRHDTVAHYLASSTSPPFLAYHASESMDKPLLDIVAAAVAQKVRTAVASQVSWASSWLGVKSSSENREGLEPSVTVNSWRSVQDMGRNGRSVALSPCGRWMATTDSLGRILQIDAATLLVLRMWKGYRDAQCGWVVEKERDMHTGELLEVARTAIFLVVYAPRRGIVELWPSDGGARIGAYSVGTQCCLLYNPSSILGQSHSPQSYPVLYQCALLHPSGNVWALRVPFAAALSQDLQQRMADQRAVRRIATSEESLLSPQELGDLLLSIGDPVLAQEALSDAIHAPYAADVLLEKCQLLRDKWQGPEEDFLRRLCLHSARLLQLIIKTSTDSQSDMMQEKDLPEALHDCCGSVDINFQHMSRILETCNDLVTSFDDSTSVERGAQLSVAEFIDSFIPTSGEVGSILELKPSLSEYDLQSVGLTLCHCMLTGDVSCADFVGSCQQAGMPVPTVVKLVLNAFITMPVFFSTGVTVMQLKEALSCLAEESGDDVWPAAHTTLLVSRWPASSWLAALLVEQLHNAKWNAGSAKSDDEGQEAAEPKKTSDSPLSWQEIHAACEEWTLLRLQLRDLVCLASVTKRGLSVDNVLSSSCSIVPRTVASWAVHSQLFPHAMYPEDIGLMPADPAAPSDEKACGSLKEEKPSFITLHRLYPFSLSHDTFLAECCHAACVAWKKDVENIDLLDLSVRYLFAIDSLVIQRTLCTFIWHSYFIDYVSNLLTLIDKIGHVVKESLCLRHVGLSWTSSIRFLSHAAAYLTVLGQVLGDDGSMLPTFDCDANWPVQRMTWPEDLLLAKLQCERLPNKHLVVLQKQLVCVLHARMDLQGKFKPSSLFSAKARQFLSQPFRQFAGEQSLADVNPELIEVRENALCQLTVSASRKTDWPARLLSLCGTLDIKDDAVRRSLIVDMFAGPDKSAHSIANQFVTQVVDKHKLGIALLNSAVQRIGDHFESDFSVKQQVEFLAGLTPNVSAWLKPQYRARPKDWKQTAASRSAIADTVGLLRLICSLLDDGCNQQRARMILDTLNSLPKLV